MARPGGPPQSGKELLQNMWHPEKQPTLSHSSLEERPQHSRSPVDGTQVWSLTQFYSVDFSKPRIGLKK